MPEIQNPAPADSFNIGDIYYLLFKHKWKIILFTLMGVVASLVVFLRTHGVYQSEAALLVRYVSDMNVLDTMSTGERITAPGRGGENVINSEIAILSSRDLVEKVIDEMGVGRFALESTNALDRARIAKNVMSAVKIEAPKNSNVIRIVFNGPAPEIAQEFLRRLTESYLQKHVEIHRQAGAYEFLSQQTDQLRSRLSETEEELRKLKYAEGIVSIEETKKSIAVRTEELAKGLDDLETTLAAAKARAEVLRPLVSASGGSRTSTVFMASEVNQTSAALRSRLLRLQQRETEMLSTYTADSVPLKGLHEQIAETQRLLDGENPTVMTSNVVSSGSVTNFTPALVEDQAIIAELQARIGFQRELLTRVMAEAKKVDTVETRIVQLQRSKELQEANYKYFCESLERARIDEALNSGRISNISIIQPATLPAGELRLKLLNKMGVALLVGIALGLGLAVLQEYFIDHTIRKPAELSTILKMPLVMSLPKLEQKRALLSSRGGSADTLLLNPHGGEKVGIAQLPAEGPAELRDLYDALRDRLLTLIGTDPSAKPYILGITSCSRGAGVSTIAAGLALALARNGAERIVLMDATAQSGAPTIFGVNPVTGLVEMVPDGAGNTEVTQHQMYSVPSGSSEPKPTYSSPAHRLAALIQHLRKSQASFVIIDMPPVTETGLTLRISRLLNGVILVIAAEKVNRHVAEHAKEWLIQSDAKIIGSILNKRRQYVPNWLYSSC
jgi:succinoglycan biosynthesis transport protein ExoP